MEEVPDRNEIVFKSDGTIDEDHSMKAMLYDVRQMIKEINNHIKKSRYRSLAVTHLEIVEHWMTKELN